MNLQQRHLVHAGQRGAVPAVALVFLGLGVIGTAVGATIGLSGGGDTTVAAPLTPVAYSRCPDAGQSGTFHRGDRVLTTGRDDSGNWFEVRDPGDLSGRVWVEAQYVVPDVAVGDLPVVACEELVTPEVTTTLPAFPGLPGPTTPGGGGGGTGGGGTGGGGTGGGGGGGPADTTGPSISAIGANPVDIWEHYAPFGGNCVSQITSALSVSISDPSGVSSATFSWSYPQGTGGGNLSPSGGSFQIGPYEEGSVSDGKVYTITVTVTAHDTRGNTSTASRALTLHASDSCSG